MNRYVAALLGPLVWMIPAIACAEETHGYSRGNAFIYYAAIVTILIYGINDVFHMKWLTWASVVVLPITFYLMLPNK